MFINQILYYIPSYRIFSFDSVFLIVNTFITIYHTGNLKCSLGKPSWLFKYIVDRILRFCIGKCVQVYLIMS